MGTEQAVIQSKSKEIAMRELKLIMPPTIDI